MLSYPSDEVGNHLISFDDLDAKGVNPYTDVLTEKQYREYFGEAKHTFTGMDYVAYYRDLITSQGAECEIIFATTQKPFYHTPKTFCVVISTHVSAPNAY
jgi:L-fucose mutarotase/ribose pyranase (RbsD/FucU family)